MWVSQVNHFTKVERNHNRSIFFGTVKHYSPVFPIECSIQVGFIKVIFVQISSFLDPKHISLPNFTLNANLSDGVLNLRVCTAAPITIILLTTSNPMALLINKIT
jgi:hypothetical protein